MKKEYTKNYGMHKPNIMFNEIILPFNKPKVQTYPYFTSLIGILDAHGKANTWIFNNYILIWALKDVYEIDYWVDFKYGNEELQSDFCPGLTKEIVLRSSIGYNDEEIRNFIHDALVKRKYVFTSVDVFYISQWWGNDQIKKHFRHQICIYGFKNHGDVLLAGDFIRGKYQVIEISFYDFLQGYSNFDSYVPYEDFGVDNWLVSVNNIVEELDLKRIYFLIRDFLHSTDSYLVNHIQLENKTESYVFGFNVIDELIKYICVVRKSKKNYLDRRPFHILYEAQRIMIQRIQFILDKYNYDDISFKKIMNKSNVILHMSEQIHFLALKYTKCFDDKILLCLIDLLKEYKSELEKCYIDYLLILEEKMC